MVWGSGLNVTSGYTAMNRRFLWSFRELLMRKLKMSLERVRAYLKSKGYDDRIIIPEQSSATAAAAAAALGCEPGMIAKTLSFLQNGADGKEEKAVLILAEGLARVDNRKYKKAPGSGTMNTCPHITYFMELPM